MKTLICLFSAFALFAGTVSAVETVLTPLAIADANEGGQADVDLSDLKGTVGFIMTAKSTAGSSPTAAIKLQSSPPPAVGFSVLTGTTAGVALRTAAATAIKLAASFTTPNNSVTPSVKSVMLPLKKGESLASGTLTLTIEADSSGPTGTALQTATFDLSTLTTAFTGATFTFTTPATLAANTKYWIVLAGDYTEHVANNVTWRTTTVASGGNASVFGSSWSASATNNLNHETYQLVFSDVSGGGFTSVTTVGSIQEVTVPIQNLGAHFRAFATIGGTSTPSFIVGIGAVQR